MWEDGFQEMTGLFAAYSEIDWFVSSATLSIVVAGRGILYQEVS
jgi:hypothetical protein